MTTVKAGEVCQRFQARLVGDPEFEIKSLGDPRSAGQDTACFVSNPAYLPAVNLSPAGFWVMTEDFFNQLAPEVKSKKVFAITKEPYLFFVRMAEIFHPTEKAVAQINPLAFVHPQATVHPTAQVEAFVTVEKNAIIEKDVILKSGAYVGGNAKIGEGSLLHPGAKVLHGCIIGKRNILHAGSVIGSDGFGFISSEGKQIKIPQVGKVILKDDVEIGATTTIDRGTFDDTLIGNGVKIDNQVQIGHNCEIGDNTIICAQSGISGNTIIGKNVLISGKVGTKGHVKIGDHVSVGAQSGISKDIPANTEVKGYPAVPLKQYLKTQVLFLRLPEIYQRLIKLEKLFGKTEGTHEHK